MGIYTVKQLSALTGVSIRTLHHYDQIGLLKPDERTESGYRHYGRAALLRLQQILFYKKLGMPLKKIRPILDEPGFDLVESLQFQRKELEQQIENLQQLLETIDKTINDIKNQTNMMTDKELYEGFNEGSMYRKEAADRWGEEMVSDTENRLKEMGKDKWKNVKAEGEAITQELVKLIDEDPKSKAVQEVIAQHYTHMNQFYEVTEIRYRGLADMYVQDERFKAYYDKYQDGLAAFVCKAIHIFCENGMVVAV